MGRKLNIARSTFKGIENASYVAALGTLASTLEVLTPVTDTVTAVAHAVMEILPDPVSITTLIPGLSSLLSNSTIAQNLALMLDLGGVAMAARLIAFLLKVRGAQRGKIEKTLAGTLKLGAGGVLAASGLDHLLFDGETLDVFRWLTPLFMENGGDVPDWLSSGDTRLGRSAVLSSVVGTGAAVWGATDFGWHKPVIEKTKAVSENLKKKVKSPSQMFGCRSK